MKSIIDISDLPNSMDLEELMEVKGGLVDNNQICSLIGCAFIAITFPDVTNLKEDV